MKLLTLTALILSIFCGSTDSLNAQANNKAPAQKPKQPNKSKQKQQKPKVRDFRKKIVPFRQPAIELAGELRKIAKEGSQVDLPAAAIDKQGRGLVAYLE